MVDKVPEALPGDESWPGGQSVFIRYLLVRHDNNRPNLMTLSTEHGAALPVFSNELAAHAFVRFNHPGRGWQVRETTAGELISLLMGHMVEADLVAVDPQPTAPDEAAVATEPVSKEDFIGALMKEPLLTTAR